MVGISGRHLSAFPGIDFDSTDALLLFGAVGFQKCSEAVLKRLPSPIQ